MGSRALACAREMASRAPRTTTVPSALLRPRRMEGGSGTRDKHPLPQAPFLSSHDTLLPNSLHHACLPPLDPETHAQGYDVCCFCELLRHYCEAMTNNLTPSHPTGLRRLLQVHVCAGVRGVCRARGRRLPGVVHAQVGAVGVAQDAGKDAAGRVSGFLFRVWGSSGVLTLQVRQARSRGCAICRLAARVQGSPRRLTARLNKIAEPNQRSWPHTNRGAQPF